MNWWRRQDFPVPALPITRNLNRKSANGSEKTKLNTRPISAADLVLCANPFSEAMLRFSLNLIKALLSQDPNPN